jgi:hypothetical protein
MIAEAAIIQAVVDYYAVCHNGSGSGVSKHLENVFAYSFIIISWLLIFVVAQLCLF